MPLKSTKQWTNCERSYQTQDLMCRRATTSSDPGNDRFGAQITRGYCRLKRNTIQAASSSSTTVWVAKNGVRMALPVRSDAAQARCRRKSHQSRIPLVACEFGLNNGPGQVVIKSLQITKSGRRCWPPMHCNHC